MATESPYDDPGMFHVGGIANDLPVDSEPWGCIMCGAENAADELACYSCGADND